MSRTVSRTKSPSINAEEESVTSQSEAVDRHAPHEIQRVTRNFLSMLRSIAQKTLENSEDLEDFSAYFSGRLEALSRAHLFYFRTTGDGIDLAELFGEELRFPAVENDDQVEITGPVVSLEGALGHGLSLAIHELATNAIKFGALSTPEGRLKVSWRVTTKDGDPWLAIDWKESGVPAVLTEPERFGFGREMIENALPYEFAAETSLRFAPGGVRCKIDVPLPQRKTRSS
jgi:two-component system CheB/CheR fusion protein